jgi:hypothetical protein
MKYLTITEFANHMRVHPNTVRAWKREGLPCVNVGKRLIRVVVVDAEKWLIARAKNNELSVRQNEVVIH